MHALPQGPLSRFGKCSRVPPPAIALSLLHPLNVSGGLRLPTPLKKSAFGIHAPEMNLMVSNVLISCQRYNFKTGSDILTSCPTYDKSACSNTTSQTSFHESKHAGRLDARDCT